MDFVTSEIFRGPTISCIKKVSYNNCHFIPIFKNLHDCRTLRHTLRSGNVGNVQQTQTAYTDRYCGRIRVSLMVFRYTLAIDHCHRHRIYERYFALHKSSIPKRFVDSLKFH